MKFSIGKVALVLAIGIAGVVLIPTVSAESWDNVEAPYETKWVSAGFNMDKFNRSILFYEEGVRQYGSSRFIGCNYLKLALQEADLVNDRGQTRKQMSPRYEQLCYTGNN